jgi:citrate lyase gamma subunit
VIAVAVSPAWRVCGERLMPFRYLSGRFNLAILIVVGALILGLVTVLGFGLAHHSHRMSDRIVDTNIKIIGFGCVLLGQIAILIGQNVISNYQHKANHDIRGEMQRTTSKVEVASEEVKRATNGDLDKRITAAAEAAIERAIPTIVRECRCHCKSELRDDT